MVFFALFGTSHIVLCLCSNPFSLQLKTTLMCGSTVQLSSYIRSAGYHYVTTVTSFTGSSQRRTAYVAVTLAFILVEYLHDNRVSVIPTSWVISPKPLLSTLPVTGVCYWKRKSNRCDVNYLATSRNLQSVCGLCYMLVYL